MAPISLDFASVPNSLSKGPEVAVAELGPMSPRLDALESLTVPKLSVIREQSDLTVTARPRFGRSVSVAFEGKGTVHGFLRFLKNERFRHMPHDGSSWDKILKWADNIGGVVLLSVGVLSEFMLNSEEATQLICDSCTSLIQLGSAHIKTLMKVFSQLHKIALALSVFLRQNQLIKGNPDVRRELAHAFQQFAHLSRDTHVYCVARCNGILAVDYAELGCFMMNGSASFYRHLEGVSISMWSSHKHCSPFDIRAIRGFLTPQDSVVKTIMSNQLYSEARRAEYTCEWFAAPLRKFTRNGKNVLLVTGAASTGKSVLARWIHEKLQESIDDEPFDILSFTIDASVKYTTSSLSLVKSLLLQLLDRRIGREHLLSHINEAIEHAQSGCTASEVEAALWKGLEHALDDRKLLILIDGLDQLSSARIGNPPALEILDRITRSKKNVKAVVLSRPVSDAALKHCQEHISLEKTHSEGSPDIKHFIQDFIYHRAELRHLKEIDRHEIVDKYAEAAHNSYVHAELLLRQIDTEDSAADILKALKPSKTTEELLDRQIGRLDSKRPETKHILTWLVAAERPLSLKEIKALLEVDLDGCAYRPFSGDVEKTVRQLCTPLVMIGDGLVSIRHPSIRERLLSHKASKFAIDLKDAHRELATRTMAYVKIHLLQKDISPASKLCDVADVRSSFLQHDLFEYAVRYWTSHFRSSSMYDKSTGKISPSAQFKIAFSNSTRLALIEGSCIARQYIACDAEKLQHLAYNVRKTLLGGHCAAVLQTLILELYVGRKFKGTTTLCEYSFEAWKLSRDICPAVTIQSLAESFIGYSKTLTVSEHSHICARKVEVLEYLVELYSHGHAELKHIEYLTILAELHVEFGHIQKAVVIYRQLYRLRLHACGHLHEHTHTLFQLLISYLKQVSLHDEVLEIYLEYHAHVDTLLVTDERRISATLALIAIYEERKEMFKAEQVLVSFWESVSVSKSTARISELKVDFALKYSKFLLRHSRKEESEVILRGVWTEIQSYSYESRFESTMIKKVQKIAEYFSRLEVFSMSRSIYQSLYEHYERHEQRTSTECIIIVRSLAETITKSISYSKSVTKSETSSSSTTTTTTIISSEEKTLTEIFESCMESIEITSTTISVCQALCSSYMYEERYEEACEIYSRVICKVWESIETTISIDVTEFIEFLSEEVLELVFNLAHCHFKMLRIDIAETIYLNLFRALICIRHIENKHFLLAKIKLVLEFFQITYKYERVIEIYRELFVYMPITWGKTHRETILVLIEFARICFKMSLYEEAATACFYVYSCFHIAHGCLHFDGFEAAFLLCQIYEMQRKWELAYEVYGYLWRTFVRFGTEYSLDVKIVQKIFTRYVFILEHHHHVEYSVYLQIAREYHEKCVTFYGHHHEITIRATLHYAHVCETREEHRETSISLYEQVIKYCKETHTDFSKKTLHTCNTRVAKMYASETKHITKAVNIYKEQYESYSKTERTSKETLTALHSLITTYKRQETKESISTATSTLKSSTMEIFQHESRSEKLIESARSIASIYRECNFSEHADTLITEMRSKIVGEIKSSISSSTTLKSNSYVFLATFQESISESSSFTSVMSELRSEVLMYTSYFHASKQQGDCRSIIKSGCSLYFHLLEKKSSRNAEFVKLEKELTEYFRKYLNFSRAVQGTTMHYFFQLYLKQISKVDHEYEVVRQATETVLKFTKTAKFSEAYDLVLLIDRFIHINGGFRSEFFIRTGFSVSRYLVGIGTNKCGDEKLYASMVELSRTILQEALAGLDDVEIDLHELQHLLTDLISTLSQQKRYQDLERILQLLWKTKTIRNNLSSSPLVLHIGRSLVQTLAALGRYSDAIHLCYHIRYNLEFIRGALDRSTLEFTVLLSELYTTQKRYRDAFELHEDIICRLGEGQTAPGLNAVDVANKHSELMRFAFKRHGKFDKDIQQYEELFRALDAEFGNEKAWKDKRPQLEKWTPGVGKEEMFGCWKRPEKFEWQIEEDESAGERVWREELVKRRVSGNLWAKGPAVVGPLNAEIVY
ncbi:hypothetical protein E8E12_009191 [Didymella heteroderae]|uniref:AAA+ ATPase domain-containing protein n=1 Tax=Didymella heteroderae TaxID=1769908 RepID=A0A9P4WWX3_9PLEO|nr:hypothetical protein E8E12_009191 [Didymella heteroderae]